MKNGIDWKTPIKLELYLDDINKIMVAFNYLDGERRLTDEEKKFIWIINMQLRNQGFEIKNINSDWYIAKRQNTADNENA